MLRTGALTLAALHAVRSLSVLLCQFLIALCMLRIAFICDFVIIKCKILRNRDVHRTALDTIPARSTRDLRSLMDDIDNFSEQHLLLLLGQRLKLLHVCRIVVHLLRCGHTAQYDHHILQACDKTDRPGSS